ncbi:cuticle protein 18.7-like isoform X1 [Armigeres subalbatus]|uniref:cuticle protein 18.7-like isoform X1 n=2 Tax=Armigeres subalbatus TaxID=124917 RepID=UPI002ED14621
MKAFVLGSVLMVASVCSGSYIPLDTPEVAAAKAAHFAAHAAAGVGGGHWDHHDVHVQKWHGPIHIPIIHKGVPVDTPEVQHAKAFHAAAHAKVAGYAHHDDHYGGDVHVQKWHGPIHIPVIHKGVPVDTPEVQHATAFHLNALAKAGSYGSYGAGAWSDNGIEHEDDGSYKPHLYEGEQY